MVGKYKNLKKIFQQSRQAVLHDANTQSIVNGLKNNEFKIYLQFIVDNKTKNIISAEALSRWDSSDGIKCPGAYIETMRTEGLISAHDFYMFELVCRQLEKWAATEYKNITLSCNFTRITLSEDGFVEKIKNIADKYKFDRNKLAIEITEDAMVKNAEIAVQNVIFCKEYGFRVYLDDLGSGYTSLANLCDYPIDVAKIDRDIVLKAESSKRGKDLFTGIINLAHSLDIKTVCEGVETEQQNSLVSLTDCDFIQGWYYAKALPLEECEEFIELYKDKNMVC